MTTTLTALEAHKANAWVLTWREQGTGATVSSAKAHKLSHGLIENDGKRRNLWAVAVAVATNGRVRGTV